jgi:hypothetical protein
MADEAEKNKLTRRGFLGVGSAALAAAGVLSVETLAGQEQSSQAPKGDRSKSDPGPTNTYLDTANPDSVNSPRCRWCTNLQVSLFVWPQTVARRWLVPRSHGARTSDLQISGGSGHAPDRRGRS